MEWHGGFLVCVTASLEFAESVGSWRARFWKLHVSMGKVKYYHNRFRRNSDLWFQATILITNSRKLRVVPYCMRPILHAPSN